MGDTDVELTDLYLVEPSSEQESVLNTESSSPADFALISPSSSYGFFSKLYVQFKQSLMDRVYNYCLPSISELPAFTSNDIIMVGGKVYKKNDTDPVPFQSFLLDFQSLLWFTYRKDFQPITPSYYTSDTGWGCMLRSGQMMLAQVLVTHLLGRDWKPISADTNSLQQYLQILQWFEDKPSAPYSVHKIAQSGINFGKQIGEWFGPSTVAQVLSELVQTHPSSNLSIYLASESMLYLDEITATCTKNNTSQDWLPVLILMPLRLGLDNINEVYIPSLQKAFAIPQSVGIVGGRPRAAMYFVACQDDCLFYMDPHIVQPYVVIDDTNPTIQQTFHCAIPQKMCISTIDPSMALGFYCKTKQDFDSFWNAAHALSKEENPIFGVALKAPEYHSTQKKEHLTIEGFEDDIVIL